MDWIETTGKTIADATKKAQDILSVSQEDLETQVLEEPKTGLFGRLKGEARIRARVLPREQRPRMRQRDRKSRGGRPERTSQRTQKDQAEKEDSDAKPSAKKRPKANSKSNYSKKTTVLAKTSEENGSEVNPDGDKKDSQLNGGSPRGANRERNPKKQRVAPITIEERTVEEMENEGQIIKDFLMGILTASNSEGTVTITRDGEYLNADVNGEDLGFLVGKKGMTLMAVQDLARLVARHKSGDGTPNRVNVDVAGYRKKRAEALVGFARSLAEQVAQTGVAKALEPMTPADRKTVHDAVGDIEGVQTTSAGREPMRYVVIQPAS